MNVIRHKISSAANCDFKESSEIRFTHSWSKVLVIRVSTAMKVLDRQSIAIPSSRCIIFIFGTKRIYYSSISHFNRKSWKYRPEIVKNKVINSCNYIEYFVSHAWSKWEESGVAFIVGFLKQKIDEVIKQRSYNYGIMYKNWIIRLLRISAAQ